jgi:hypothetical protein
VGELHGRVYHCRRLYRYIIMPFVVDMSRVTTTVMMDGVVDMIQQQLVSSLMTIIASFGM